MIKYFNIIILLLISLSAFSSGYKIPEQSFNSVALSGAYLSNTQGADSSYYNPANMIWQKEGAQYELGLININLTKLEYIDRRSSVFDSESKQEFFLLPTFHYISNIYDKMRFGLSLAYPAGLTKRWDSIFAKASAKEFSMNIVELNPTFSYLLNENISIGGGIRGLYAFGTVKSQANKPMLPVSGSLESLSREIEGNSFDIGYNISISAIFKEDFKWALAYRSKNYMKIDGEAEMIASYKNHLELYDGDVSLKVLVPAVLSSGISFFREKISVEFLVEKTYWSKYKKLDFNYDTSFGKNSVFYPFDSPVHKNWSNSKAYRLGVTYNLKNNANLLFGYSKDNSPVPIDTLGFELPDADADIYSFGYLFQYSDRIKLGVSALLSRKKSIHVKNNDNHIEGKFKNGKAYLFNISCIIRL